MDKALYVAMTGASQAMLSQSVHANNLANTETIGFRSAFAQTRAVTATSPDHESTRVYALAESPGINHEEGSLMMTGRDLDIAINGEGWIALEDEKGNEYYTRAGNMQIDEFRNLRSSTGHIVMGNAGPLIIPEFEALEIGLDGTISIRGLGQDENSLTQIDRIKLVTPDLTKIKKNEHGLYTRSDGEKENPNAAVRVQVGALEGSNVNAIDDMISVMKISRSFELQVKLMTQLKENDEKTESLLKIS